MAFNEFDRPLEAQPIQTYVSQHVALPFKEYRAAIQDKQNQFDETAAEIDAQEMALARVRAMPHDVAHRKELEDAYTNRIREAVEKNKGDLSAGSQDFRSISKSLKNDLDRGALGAMDKKVVAASEFAKKIEDRIEKKDITKEQGELATAHAMAFTQPVQRGVLKEGEGYSKFQDFDPANYLDQSKKFEDLAGKLKEDAEKGTTEVYDPETKLFVKQVWGTKDLNPNKIYNTLMGSHYGDDASVGYTEDMGKLHNDLKLYDVKGVKVNRELKTAQLKEELNNKIALGEKLDPWEYETDPEHRKVAQLAWSTAQGFAHKETETSKTIADATVYGSRLADADSKIPPHIDILKTFDNVPSVLGATEEENQTKKLTGQNTAKTVLFSELDQLIKSGNTAAAEFKTKYTNNPEAVTQGLLDGSLEIPGMSKGTANKTIQKFKASIDISRAAAQRESEINKKAGNLSGFTNKLYLDHAVVSGFPGIQGNMQDLVDSYIKGDLPLGNFNPITKGVLNTNIPGIKGVKYTEAQVKEINALLIDGKKRYNNFLEHKEVLYQNTGKVQQTQKLSSVPPAQVWDSTTKTYKQDEALATKASKAVSSYLGNLANLTDLNGSIVNEAQETEENVNIGSKLSEVFGDNLSNVKPSTVTFSTIAGQRFAHVKYLDDKTNKKTTVTVNAEDLDVAELKDLNNSGANKADAEIERIRTLGIEKYYPIPSKKDFELVIPQDREVDRTGKETKPRTDPYFMVAGVKNTLDEGKRQLSHYYEEQKKGNVESSTPTWESLYASKASLAPNKTYTYIDNGVIHSVLGENVINHNGKKN